MLRLLPRAPRLPAQQLFRTWAARVARNREARTVALFALANLGLGLVSNRVLTELVQPEALGRVYLFQNLALWLSLPSAAGYVYVMRHWPLARASGETGRLLRGLWLGVLAQAALACAGAAGFAYLGLASAPGPAFVLLAVAATAQGVSQLLEPVQVAERRRVTVGTLGLLGNPLRQLLLAATAGLTAGGSFAALWTTQTAHAVLLALAALLALRALLSSLAAAQGPGGAPGLTRAGLITFALPYLLTAAFGQVATSAERWGLARIADPAATALFVQGLGLSLAAVSAVAGVLASYYLPIIGQAASAGPLPIRGAAAPIRRYVGLTLATVALAAVTAAAASDLLTPLVFGARFVAVAALLPWTVLGAACFSLGQALSVFAHCARETVSPNAARISSQAVYLGLLALPTGPAPALDFARRYALSSALYALLMAASALWHVRRERGAQLRTP